ncbi:MAG TPA: hypothetical protein VNA04_09895, partial [Thermoanaerobaculia bacterium]|nr:hypothetical protein [Thermoanaerobaculia bacterium]
GTLQIRSLETHPVAVTGKVFNVARADGLFGTSLASFRSDRGASGSQRVVLPGIRGEGADSTRFFVQEVSGITTAARTEILDATGGVLLSRTDDLEPFAMRELAIAVPPGAVTAVVTNTGAGRVIARALLSDAGSGDITDLVDWTIRNAIGPTEPQLIPILDRGAGSRQTELIIANRGPETLRGTLSSFSSGPGRRRAVAHGSGGGGFPFRTGWNAVRTPARPDAAVEIDLPAGQTRVLADALAELGAPGASHLVFTPAAGSGSITARTQRTFAGGGVFRTALPVVSSGVAMRLGETREFGGIESAGRTASDARQVSSFGSSLTLVETAGQQAVVRVTLQFTPAIASGLVSLRGQAKKDYTLEANKLLQIADIAAEIIGPSRGQFGDLRNMQIDVSVVSGQGAVVPILTERENATGDLIVRLE